MFIQNNSTYNGFINTFLQYKVYIIYGRVMSIFVNGTIVNGTIFNKMNILHVTIKMYIHYDKLYWGLFCLQALIKGMGM